MLEADSCGTQGSLACGGSLARIGEECHDGKCRGTDVTCTAHAEWVDACVNNECSFTHGSCFSDLECPGITEVSCHSFAVVYVNGQWVGELAGTAGCGEFTPPEVLQTNLNSLANEEAVISIAYDNGLSNFPETDNRYIGRGMLKCET